MKWGFEHDAHPLQSAVLSTTIAARSTSTAPGTTSPLADFLLGLLNAATRTVGWNRNYLRATSMGGYFVDDFQAEAEPDAQYRNALRIGYDSRTTATIT